MYLNKHNGHDSAVLQRFNDLAKDWSEGAVLDIVLNRFCNEDEITEITELMIESLPSEQRPVSNVLTKDQQLIVDSLVNQFTRINNSKVVVIPGEQVDIIRKALELYGIVHNKVTGLSTQDQVYLDHDITCLTALMRYEVSVTLTNSQYDSFTSDNGVDIPLYT